MCVTINVKSTKYHFVPHGDFCTSSNRPQAFIIMTLSFHFKFQFNNECLTSFMFVFNSWQPIALV